MHYCVKRTKERKERWANPSLCRRERFQADSNTYFLCLPSLLHLKGGHIEHESICPTHPILSVSSAVGDRRGGRKLFIFAGLQHFSFSFFFFSHFLMRMWGLQKQIEFREQEKEWKKWGRKAEGLWWWQREARWWRLEVRRKKRKWKSFILYHSHCLACSPIHHTHTNKLLSCPSFFFFVLSSIRSLCSLVLLY